MPEDETSASSTLLLGRYRPERLLSRGGMASVYLGRDEHIGRSVAIKLLNAGTAIDLQRYQAELDVLAGLNHHGLVSIVDAGVDDSVAEDPRPFLVMQLVPGITLERTLRERRLRSRQIAEITIDIAEALEYVHRSGLIHRDVTPSNIMIVNYGTESSRERAMLTDFGLAIETSGVPAGERSAGTAAYVSPEQALNEPLTPATDIYSLGLVALQCFTNQIEYPGTVLESLTERLRRDPAIPDALPEPWPAMLRQMTDRVPASRPVAEEVAAAARQLLRATSARHKGRRATDVPGSPIPGRT